MNFEQQLEWGEEGEELVASYLIGCGVTIAPLYQFNADQAPFLLNNKEKLILPDLTCWNKGVGYFVECKRKNQWVSFDGNIETGLDQKHYSHYQKIKRATGQNVWIFFLHEKQDPQGMFFGEIDGLDKHKRLWDGCSPSGKQFSKPLVLFPISTLKAITNKEVTYQVV